MYTKFKYGLRGFEPAFSLRSFGKLKKLEVKTNFMLTTPSNVIPTNICRNCKEKLEENGEDTNGQRILTNDQVLDCVGEKRTLINKILHRKANWIVHILRRN